MQGIFRGEGDTRIPLYATVASNALNVVLAPLFIFTLNGGVQGAAFATVPLGGMQAWGYVMDPCATQKDQCQITHTYTLVTRTAYAAHPSNRALH